MPCDSSYLNPTSEEKDRVEVAKLLVYVYRKLRIPCDDTLLSACENIYGTGIDLTVRVPELCSVIKNLTPYQLEHIVYNGHDKNSRRLADWWEHHQEADKNRIKKENENLRKQALLKLTAEEKKALGIINV